MLTIRAEIKRSEQKVDGTYNVKLRFTLNRKVKRLSTSLFARETDLTRTGNFKKSTPLFREIERLISAYQTKCAEMQIDLNNYSLEYIFQKLKFDERKNKCLVIYSYGEGRIIVRDYRFFDLHRMVLIMSKLE